MHATANAGRCGFPYLAFIVPLGSPKKNFTEDSLNMEINMEMNMKKTQGEFRANSKNFSNNKYYHHTFLLFMSLHFFT
jgi:hypothetical protein